ncbi:MAG: FAD/NAD(P)-binding protein [Planctomycetota bacterium]|nr:FAD/NAD(P)-binding protein [Planctomycetota bacterium]
MKTIVIVGGGFSGTMAAVNLSRLSQEPLRVIIVNSKRPLGRGTAYSTVRNEHLLNVAARNMSAFPDFPEHFLGWLRSRSEYANVAESELREMYVPRRVYGDYLCGLLATCQQPIDARCHVQVETIDNEVVDIVVADPGETIVLLKNGDSLDADQVLLATGNQPPGSFPSDSPLGHDPRYRSDPWHDWVSRLPDSGGKIVLLGTGLTMVDVVLTLNDLQWDGEIIAVSRNGMPPQSHFRGIAYEDYIPENSDQLDLDQLRALVQQHCNQLRQMSQNPAIAIDKLRPHTQRLWQQLTVAEKQSFLDQDAALWNVTRHRIAVSIHDTVTDALDSGRLKLRSGLIERLAPNEENIEVILRDRDGKETSEFGDLVINCTGPQDSFTQSGVPLFENLLNKGLVLRDDLDKGLQVNEHFAVIENNGQASSWLYAMGPLLKGSLWETTAVPELRGQAMRIAEILLQQTPAEVPEQDVLEYYI